MRPEGFDLVLSLGSRDDKAPIVRRRNRVSGRGIYGAHSKGRVVIELDIGGVQAERVQGRVQFHGQRHVRSLGAAHGRGARAFPA